MDGRKRLSGAKYKKNALIKKQKHTVLLNSCLKIDDMFKSSTLTTEGKLLFYFAILFI